MIKQIFKRVDTLLHIYCCAAIFLVAWSVSSIWLANWPAFIVGVFSTVAAAFTKEVWDYYHPDKHKAEAIDIVSDCIGLLTAALPVAVFYIF